jgi:ribonuclease PH
MVKDLPLKDHVAAVSCGIVNRVPVLDLDYDEDSTAHTDANFVITGKGGLVELQGTGESAPFSQEEFLEMLRLAQSGIAQLVELQKQVIGAK